MITNDKLKLILPYIGIPIITIALFFIQLGHIDIFILLLFELITVFGYVSTVIDIKSKRISNNLILAMIGTWILMIIPKLLLDIDSTVIFLKDSVFGFLIGGGIFLVVYLISRKGLGGGDVKFMAAAGLYLGFERTLSAMLYGTVLAGLAGLMLLLLKKLGRKDTMPLAPFLYIGILITVFYR